MTPDKRFKHHILISSDYQQFDPEPHDTLDLCKWMNIDCDVYRNGRGIYTPNLNERLCKEAENQISRYKCGRDAW